MLRTVPDCEGIVKSTVDCGNAGNAGPPETVPELPERLIMVGDVGALLTNDTLPFTLPLAVGTNFNVKLELLPAATVNGSVRPLVLNSDEPLMFAAVTVKLAPPVFEMVTA